MSFTSCTETFAFSLLASKPNYINTFPKISGLTDYKTTNATTHTTTTAQLAPSPHASHLDQLYTNLPTRPTISYPSPQCINTQYPEKKRLDNKVGLLRNQRLNGQESGLCEVHSPPNLVYETPGIASNLDSLGNFGFEFGKDESQKSSLTLKVPNNTPVDSLAAAGPEFVLHDINSDSLATSLYSRPLYSDQTSFCDNHSLFDDKPELAVFGYDPSRTPVQPPEPCVGNALLARPNYVLEKNEGQTTRKRSRDEEYLSMESEARADDGSDSKAAKRARNTLAARKSRDRKKREMDELKLKANEQEKMIMQLLAEVNLLRSINSLPPR